ncbi:hypothetical protein FR932_04670 [Moritella marina ATCC 15381]|uniref:Uncharacterized protein n=1 Tax=Moritella marina ATCC 15381 TaxID=1202962 RepID=A0A5J6WJ07_MORMI|nr:hypothetical protein [Moritella marina]QFI37171.1 hypothetical protein FR932_04670 [Moritella marina ATCC 15381]
MSIEAIDIEGTETIEIPLFENPSMTDFEISMNKFNTSINSQFMNVSTGSQRINFNGILSVEGIDSKAKKIITNSNYEINALDGELVILFTDPLYVSMLTCRGKSFRDSKSCMIRLISGEFSEKKFISRHSVTSHGREAEYKINDIIRGVILSPSTEFSHASAIDFPLFFSDDIKMNSISDAHKGLSLEAETLRQTIFNQVNDVTSYLDTKTSDYKALVKDMNTATKEKERLEKSNAQNSLILNQIQHDIAKTSEEAAKYQLLKMNAAAEIDGLKASINEHKDIVKSESREFDVLLKDVADKKIELLGLKDEIRTAKKDINLTSLDMKGHSTESQKQLTYYYRLSLAVIVFLAAVFFFIYSNAETFKVLIDANSKVSPWNILLSRLPLITATTLIIGTLSALLFYLVNHIILVNADKMNMLKASILAEQITGTLSSKGMTDEEIRDCKRNTKIELVMNVFTTKPEKVSESKQQDVLKQILEAVKITK